MCDIKCLHYHGVNAAEFTNMYVLMHKRTCREYFKNKLWLSFQYIANSRIKNKSVYTGVKKYYLINGF